MIGKIRKWIIKSCTLGTSYVQNKYQIQRSDRSFSFVTKTPPAAVLIKKACNLKSGSGVPNKTKVAKITKAQVKEIAELKMPDLNAASVETAMSMIEGTCRSMGVTVVED